MRPTKALAKRVLERGIVHALTLSANPEMATLQVNITM
jgi:hypothetical protein